MSSYAIYDFNESLNILKIIPEDVESVVAAWGDSGDYAEWEGGFIMKMKDGRYAYLSGWCDTSGWGCQDGAEVEYSDTEPSRDSHEWDEEPADLNKWLSENPAQRSVW